MPAAINGRKICAKCKVDKPATTDYFARASNRPDGLKPYCKECIRVPIGDRKKNRSQYKTVDGISYKTCTMCGDWKAANSENFSQQNGKLLACCKECLRKKRGTKNRASRNDAKIIDGMLRKRCTKCGTLHPAITEFFPAFKEGKLGLHPWCKDCIRKSAYDRSVTSGRVKSHRTKPELIDDVLYRKCRICNQRFPATIEYFNPQSGRTSGIRSTCKNCQSAQRTVWQEKNKEKIIARVKEWIQKNKYRHRQHALANKAKRRAAEGSFNADDIQKHYEKQKGKCYYCLVELDHTYEVDHFIPISKGGTNYADNIVLACKECNRAKSSKDPYKFLEKKRVEAAISRRT